MALSETETIEIVRRNRGGTFESIFGPCNVGGVRIFQVWVHITSDDEYDTRFVTEVDKEEPKYFASFTAVCEYLNNQYKDVATRAGGHEAEFQLRKFSQRVAALAFISTLALLLYMVLTTGTNETLIVTALLGVVASGGALFFGKWIAVNTQK